MASYIPECDLFVGRSERERRLLVPYGELTEERLVSFTAPPGETLSMRLAQKQLTGLDLARWNRRADRPEFHAPSRLARVGIFARLIDTAFNASLLLRGTVPGGTTAAAHLKYEKVRQTDPRYVYHGRVLRSEGWIVLHYMYFYFMNDWRSTFSGANDHESDLEQAFVFLEDAPDGPRPVWFACAAHDYSGDQLRRRWDDPYLVKVGDHPVIHAGAGSHAAYFEAGEYMTAAPLPAARRLRGILEATRSFWRDTLRQPDPGDLAASLERALSIPFIDYARGDGLQIGGEGGATWTPVLIDDSVPWVDGYRGLLGLDTFDRFAGERAPAGPKYTRSGTARQSWNDPIGWAGLAKTAPPFRMPTALEAHLTELEADLATLRAENDAAAASLDGLDLEVRALATDQSFAAIHESRAAELAKREAEVNAGRSREAVLADSILAGRRELDRLRAGDLGDPRAHLHGDHHPVPPEMTRYGRIVEIWAAISISLVLVGMVALVWFTDRAVVRRPRRGLRVLRRARSGLPAPAHDPAPPDHPGPGRARRPHPAVRVHDATRHGRDHRPRRADALRQRPRDPPEPSVGTQRGRAEDRQGRRQDPRLEPARRMVVAVGLDRLGRVGLDPDGPHGPPDDALGAPRACRASAGRPRGARRSGCHRRARSGRAARPSGRSAVAGRSGPGPARRRSRRAPGTRASRCGRHRRRCGTRRPGGGSARGARPRHRPRTASGASTRARPRP